MCWNAALEVQTQSCKGMASLPNSMWKPWNADLRREHEKGTREGNTFSSSIHRVFILAHTSLFSNTIFTFICERTLWMVAAKCEYGHTLPQGHWNAYCSVMRDLVLLCAISSPLLCAIFSLLEYSYHSRNLLSHSIWQCSSSQLKYKRHCYQCTYICTILHYARHSHSKVTSDSKLYNGTLRKHKGRF